jgi:hypothetical protein
MDLTELPTPKELSAEMALMLRRGVTVKGLTACPAVLSLAVVRGKAASDDVHDLAAAAHGLLREVVVFAEGEPNGPAGTLLGLATGTRGTLLKDRRQWTADQLFISPAHLRTSDRESALIESVAEELYAFDSAYRLRHRHRTERERDPPASGLRIDWLDRHQAYRRVWTPVAAMRNDIPVLLALLEDERNHNDIIDRLVLIAWRYAQFVTELERFIDKYGGLWVLSDIDSEVAAVEAVQHLLALAPLGDADDSWLRIVLRNSEAGELESFSQKLPDDETGVEILGAWLQWAKDCACTPSTPVSVHCRVHRWLATADEFTNLLDSDWLAVADWYRLDVDRAGPPYAGS